ncbi:hypothetical protein V8C26DRAFT_409926 [Trichoderma gracile]
MRPAIVFRTANGSLPPELLDYDGLDAFKHYFMTLPSLIFSGILLLLHTVSNIVWARCQRKLVLHLKGPLPTSERVKPPKDDSRCVMMAVLLHISMYIDFIEVRDVGWVVTWELLVQALIASLIPLVIPSRFYCGWPTISKGFFLCWACIWHQHTYMWILTSMEIYYAGLFMVAFLISLSAVLAERLSGRGPENQQRRGLLSETFSRSMPYWKQVKDSAWELYWN